MPLVELPVGLQDPSARRGGDCEPIVESDLTEEVSRFHWENARIVCQSLRSATVKPEHLDFSGGLRRRERGSDELIVPQQRLAFAAALVAMLRIYSDS